MIPNDSFTLAAAKEHLRVYHAEEDNTILLKLDAAVARCEEYTGKAWTEREHIVVRVVDCCAHLPLVPCAFVESMEYQSTDGTMKEYVDGAWKVATLRSGEQKVQVTTLPDDLDPAAPEVAQFVYTAGVDAPVPPAVVAAAMLYLGDLYEVREAQVVGTIVAPNRTAEALLDPHRITWGV